MGKLHEFVASRGFTSHWNSQTDAWKEEIQLLQQSTRDLLVSTPTSSRWNILLEFEIARRGKRIDALIVAEQFIAVVEFKVGASAADAGAVWQVHEYALDLRDFHGGSSNVPILSILVPTKLNAKIEEDFQSGERSFPGLGQVFTCGPHDLAKVFALASGDPTITTNALIDFDKWLEAPYRPSLNIIEAAQKIFAGHEVREISHAAAVNLSDTVDAIVEAVATSEKEARRTILFVTGVPGAGKTLAGLSAVHNAKLRHEGRPTGMFLSGNGPLVKVVRAALVRDQRSRGAQAQQVRRQISTFVDNVHSFLTYYAFENLNETPNEKVVVFDEAQRAWDAKQMASKKRGDKSEAQLMLEVMERCPHWSVIVALVGFGQEIHSGEGGLQEWGKALANSTTKWTILASPVVSDVNSGHQTMRLFADPSSVTKEISADQRLHLKTNIRSFRASAVSRWVESLLDCDEELARELFVISPEFPMAYTRDLERAKNWLRSHSDRSELSGSCGLVASSGALRLRAYGIEVSSGFRRGVTYEDWFLNGPGDIRSSSALARISHQFLWVR